eukprot:Hpha_TRINITY_DN10598_c0_g1::TRINITY_DN10598_c0_g1_i1::g.31413::m.31413
MALPTPTPPGGVHVESFPGLEDNPGSLLLLIVGSLVVISLPLGLAIKLFVSKTVKLPLLFFVGQFSAIVTAVLVTWAVGYSAARGTIDDAFHKHVILSGELAAVQAHTVLDDAGRATEALAQALVERYKYPLPVYPDSVFMLKNILAQTGEDEITHLYYGTEDGDFHGVQPLRQVTDDPADAGSLRVLIGSKPTIRERRCSESAQDGRCLGLPTCMQAPTSTGYANSSCRFCFDHTMGVPQGAPGCHAFVPAIRGMFTLPADFKKWDLPSGLTQREYKASRYCKQAPAASEGTLNGTNFITGSRGRSWEDGLGVCSNLYDPRLRSWYKSPEVYASLVWTTVYKFASPVGGEATPMGVSALLAIPNPYYDGTPWTGGTPLDYRKQPWLGVAGADVTMSSMSRFLERSKPTENSHLFLVEVGDPATEGVIAASSLPAKERAAGRDPRLAEDSDVLLTAKDGTWKWRSVFAVIERRFGSLTAAARESTAVFQNGRDTVTSTPVRPVGGLWLAVVWTPYEDTLQDMERASTVALALAFAVGIVAGAIMFGLIGVAVRPLKAIEASMRSVARMEFDGIELQSSVVTELSDMRDHFEKMVKELRHYREFMPQSVLLSDQDLEEDDAVSSPRSLGRSFRSKMSITNMNMMNMNMSMSMSCNSIMSNSGILDHIPRRPRSPSGGEILVNSSSRPELKSKIVSVVIFNKKGLITVARRDIQELTDIHSEYINNIIGNVLDHKGVADPFVGDRLLVHFNALIQHQAHAKAACHLCNKVRNQADESLFCGVVTAKGQCGVAGVEGMRKFTVFGPAPVAASVLVNIATRKKASVVVDQGNLMDSVAEYYFMALTRIFMPKLRRVPTTLFEMRESKGDDEEWMYQMESRESENPYSHYNEAFVSLMDGNLSASLHDDPWLTRIHHAMTLAPTEETSPVMCIQDGRYYENFYLPIT